MIHKLNKEYISHKIITIHNIHDRVTQNSSSVEVYIFLLSWICTTTVTSDNILSWLAKDLHSSPNSNTSKTTRSLCHYHKFI